jgi:hypothetical protein
MVTPVSAPRRGLSGWLWFLIGLVIAALIVGALLYLLPDLRTSLGIMAGAAPLPAQAPAAETTAVSAPGESVTDTLDSEPRLTGTDSVTESSTLTTTMDVTSYSRSHKFERSFAC